MIKFSTQYPVPSINPLHKRPTEFQAALTTAQSNGEPDTINVAGGTYNVAAGGTLTYSAVATENASLVINGADSDLVFLDVKMPGRDGIQALRELRDKLPEEVRPLVVFTTAYDQYALKAFEVNSIDYLVKPVEMEQLDRALNKMERIRGGAETPPKLDTLLSKLSSALAREPGAPRAFTLESPAGPVSAAILDNGEVSICMGVPATEPARVPFIADEERLLYPLDVDGRLLFESGDELRRPSGLALTSNALFVADAEAHAGELLARRTIAEIEQLLPAPGAVAGRSA